MDKIKMKMKIEMDVTKAQGLTLQSMFEHMNNLSNIGSSREVGFYCDGDGNFHPNCKVSFDGDIPELTNELREIAVVRDKNGDVLYDFDPVAWKINHQ